MNITFTYVIVGGGSAGCVLANKLSENPENTVLLIEAGPEDKNPMIRIPKGFAKVVGQKKFTYSFAANPGGTGKDSEETWIRGRTLGGSSSINGLQYQRGNPADYEHWENDLGLQGWGWKTMGPIFKNMEDHELGETDFRGIGGPVHITQTKNKTMLMDKLIMAAGQLGVPSKADPNEPDQFGISYICANIHKGERWSSAKAFLQPARHRTNLTVVTLTEVARLLFEGTRVKGVRCHCNGVEVDYFCTQEVILSAGAMMSPKILQLSGIGDREHLSRLGISVVAHSPEVGENMREHLIFTTQFRLTGDYSQNKEYQGWRMLKNAFRYMLTQSGLLAGSAYDVTAFIKSLPGSTCPDAQLVCSPITMDLEKWEGFHKGIPLEKKPGCSMLGYAMKPESKGFLKISSADPQADMEIVHNHLSHEHDRQVAVAIVRYIRNLFSQSAIAPYIKEELLPGKHIQTDEEILLAYNTLGGPGYHTAGTCRMGVDASSVVDSQLRVNGVQGLRVVDLSVFPTLVSGNTHGPVMAVAWRGAQLILDKGRG
jgi:choline dehydrogenase